MNKGTLNVFFKMFKNKVANTEDKIHAGDSLIKLLEYGWFRNNVKKKLIKRLKIATKDYKRSTFIDFSQNQLNSG